MKKIFTLCIAALAAVSVSAQHEIGVIVGGLNGLSHKYWFSDNVAVQTDLAVGLTVAYCNTYSRLINSYTGGYAQSKYDFTLNPNLAYHFDMSHALKVYVGGGLNIGMISYLKNTNPNFIAGKAGANALVGLSCGFRKVPLVMAFDFRPGYGIAFTDEKSDYTHFFDWKLGLALRYVL
jgi:outer membrane protein W